jgi:restriction endonuclease Mrr
MSCCKTYDPCRDQGLNKSGSFASAARQYAEIAKASAELAEELLGCTLTCKLKVFEFALDTVEENVWYRGYILKAQLPGPPTAPGDAPFWEIEKTVLTYSGGNEILTTTYATGAWNNRESLIYT